MLAHSVPNGRGEVGLMPCPECSGFHRSIYRISGIPVLECDGSHLAAGEPRLRRVLKSARGGLEFIFVVGPEPEPVVTSKPVSISLDTDSVSNPVTTTVESAAPKRRTA